jgi:hypothetical protein
MRGAFYPIKHFSDHYRSNGFNNRLDHNALNSNGFSFFRIDYLAESGVVYDTTGG